MNDGWHVGVAARRSYLLYDLQRQFPERVLVANIDVRQENASLELLAMISKMGGMDLFFYAAGIGKQNPELYADIETATVDTNALGFTRMISAAFRYFSANDGGHIVAISSIAGTKGLGLAPSYSATKAFQNVYLQSLEQLATIRRLNISVTDIRPGFVDTALLHDCYRYPMLMRPEHVAEHIVRAIYKRRHVVIIDWRWRFVTIFWRLIPNYLWRKAIFFVRYSDERKLSV